jgi:nitroreductase
MTNKIILDLIENRWSPYSFSSQPIEEFKLKAMLEAARFAPSCNNEQPWIFVYTTNEEPVIFNDFIGFLSDTNKEWAKNAFALIISFARTKFTYKNRPNRYAFHDTGMAVTNLLLQAASMNIFVHQMAGYSLEKVKEYFMLDDDTEPVAIMAAGYIGDGSGLSDELLKRDGKRRPRKSVNEYVFKNKPGNPAFTSL